MSKVIVENANFKLLPVQDLCIGDWFIPTDEPDRLGVVLCRTNYKLRIMFINHDPAYNTECDYDEYPYDSDIKVIKVNVTLTAKVEGVES